MVGLSFEFVPNYYHTHFMPLPTVKTTTRS